MTDQERKAIADILSDPNHVLTDPQRTYLDHIVAESERRFRDTDPQGYDDWINGRFPAPPSRWQRLRRRLHR